MDDVATSLAVNVSDLLLRLSEVESSAQQVHSRLDRAGIADPSSVSDPSQRTEIGHRLELAEKKLQDMEMNHNAVLLPMDAAWVLSCATLVFLMQLGFAQLEAGMCRPKNVVATYLKNITDFVLGTLCTLVFGFAIAYDQKPLYDTIDAWKFFFHLVFQATASTIVSGAMAERMEILGYIVITMVLSGFIYAVSVRLTWGGGLLTQMDPPFHDFAGSGVVHLLGGAAALAGTTMLGARKGRWQFPDHFRCHSVPQVLSGVLLLWVGWYGFNPGSTGAMSTSTDALIASNAAMTTTISAASAGTYALVSDLVLSEGAYIDVMKFANSVLGGLVAITAGCDVLGPWTSTVAGLVGAIVMSKTADLLIKCKIDDVVDATPVHGACGAWGCLAVGLLHPDDGLLFGGGWWLLFTQAISVVVIAALGLCPIYFLCWCLDMWGWLRCSLEEERKGIDMHVFKVTTRIPALALAPNSLPPQMV
jgi:Amt family ammonium transporter